MKIRSLSVIAAVALLAACSSAPEDDAGMGGAGMGAGAGAGAGAGVGAGGAGMGAGQYAPGSVEEFRQVVGDRVFFGTDEYAINAEAQATLRRQAQWLQQYPQASLLIEGHADERGTREYNLALGERRAVSVRDFLAAQGVSPSRINVVSYGKERPVCAESSQACWAENRRGVTVLR
ncbi:peptidoglycan-associated lipoprotein Pal [Caenispirillum bisanense]|uniref:Peptidoglycan-associated lipoprotein n=1 Tax=Caenispirillum bisanense TaxID=414052 RepID=A0A286GPY6_9PROT|nr:peptidoglycan-associated lipoprotein Pal [Caenispirillum bisanense]SOD97607.1 peptidoglycan-associated lipoprotein [Caenispirillum bisanense]